MSKIDFELFKAIDFCDDVRDGTHDSPKHLESGKVLITSKNINNDEIDFSNVTYISDEDFNKINERSLVEVNDILYSMIGTVGLVHRVSTKPDYAIKNMGLFKISDELKSKWLYYYLHSPEAKNEINSKLSGSTQKFISLGNLRNISIKYPVNSQDAQKIVSILETIDKKIMINNQINKTLYKTGELLYKHFFDNDNYMSEYSTKSLCEVTNNNRNKINIDKSFKVLSAINTGQLVLSDDYFYKQVYSKDLSKYLVVNKNDFAYNPARINIGSIGLNNYEYNCCVSPVYVTFSVDPLYVDYFDFYFKTAKFKDEVNLRASGSVRQSLNYNEFGMIEINYPSERLIKEFNDKYSVLKNRIVINEKKIEILR